MTDVIKNRTGVQHDATEFMIVAKPNLGANAPQGDTTTLPTERLRPDLKWTGTRRMEAS